MITYGILAGVMQYIGLIIILWGAFFIYALVRLFRKDSIPMIIAIGIPFVIWLLCSDTLKINVDPIAVVIAICVFIGIVISEIYPRIKKKSNNMISEDNESAEK